MNISEMVMFEETVCVGCLHHKDVENDPCFVLGMIAANGASEAIYDTSNISETGCMYGCRMKITHTHDISDIDDISDAISTASTELVAEVYDAIVESWHWSVISVGRGV